MQLVLSNNSAFCYIQHIKPNQSSDWQKFVGNFSVISN